MMNPPRKNHVSVMGLLIQSNRLTRLSTYQPTCVLSLLGVTKRDSYSIAKASHVLEGRRRRGIYFFSWILSKILPTLGRFLGNAYPGFPKACLGQDSGEKRNPSVRRSQQDSPERGSWAAHEPPGGADFWLEGELLLHVFEDRRGYVREALDH